MPTLSLYGWQYIIESSPFGHREEQILYYMRALAVTENVLKPYMHKKKKYVNFSLSSFCNGDKSHTRFFLLVIFLLVSIHSLAQIRIETINGLRYIIDAVNVKATLVRYDRHEYEGDIVIPKEVTAKDFIKYPVVALDENCFLSCSSLKSVLIPSSVVSLGDDCFNGCSSLRNVSLPSSIVRMGEGCFCGCKSLEAIDVPSSIISLGDYCFAWCDNLKHISLSPSLTTIGNNCFNGCSSLESVEVPSSVISLGDWCFAWCTNLKSILLPPALKSLGESCFYGSSSFSSIRIPSSVAEIGKSCFSHCSSLKNISIPSSVPILQDECFLGDTSLVSIVIPPSVLALGNSCFQNCYNLSEISLPSSIRTIGNECFVWCKNLTNVSIPSSVNTVGDACFLACKGLKNITLCPSVSSLGASAFFGCDSLGSITIPSSVKNIGERCFEGCSMLKSIYFKGEPLISLKETSIPTNCSCFVVNKYAKKYKEILGEDNSLIKVWNGDDGISDKLEMCSLPIVSLVDEKLHFSCNTRDAVYHYTIKNPDIVGEEKVIDGTVPLSASYDIFVYATADNFGPSETVKASLYWIGASIKNSIKNTKLASKRSLLLCCEGNNVTLSGLNEREKVLIYSMDGKQVACLFAVNGKVFYASKHKYLLMKVSDQTIKASLKN